MRTSLALILAALALAPAASAAPATVPAPLLTKMRLDGLGPLKLGMTRTAAVKTGWISDRAKGCELASPRPLQYQLNGRKAPDPLQGFVYFVDDRLTGFDLTTGVQTATGVEPGKTTVSQMISRYRKAGFSAAKRYDSTFDATFVTVKRKHRTVIEGFAIRKQKRVRDLSIPFTALCD